MARAHAGQVRGRDMVAERVYIDKGEWMRTPMELTAAEFKRIYTEKKFRNAVAHAHGCCKAAGEKPIFKKAFDWPLAWAVSDEQIQEAREEIARACVKTLAENKGKLLLVGMGWPQAAIGENDIGNPRARGNFRDPQGRLCFVEINHREEDGESLLWFDFAHRVDAYEKGDQHHLLPDVHRSAFSKANVLRYVNSAFGTAFKEVVIDNYDLNPGAFVSEEDA